MKRGLFLLSCAAALAVFLQAPQLYGATHLNDGMRALVDGYLAQAKRQDPSVKALSAQSGKKFFNSKRAHSVKKEDRSCSMCHTADPTQSGKTPVGKVIEPMAPSVNKERFTDPKKVEKWFKRNCEYVLERECTPKEKGDFITYMLSL